ncbi:hypothetical protein MPLA_290072 [Mesorhizobium sp. ORS 3359]|nr:hypothetical protein MPLA_290072 [Mesorhizobium sp. ORS 3359]
MVAPLAGRSRRLTTRGKELEPQRPVGPRQPGRTVRLDRHSFDHLGRSFQHQIGRTIDLIEASHNLEAEAHELMKLGTPLANGQGFKTQNRYSVRGTSGYRHSDRLRERDRHPAECLHLLAYSESRRALQPERFARCQFREVRLPARGCRKLLERVLNLIDRGRRTFHLVQDSVHEHRRPGIPEQLVVMHGGGIEIGDQHDAHSVCCRGDLQHPALGCLRPGLAGSYPATERQADRQPVVLVQQGGRLLQRVLGSLCALPCGGHFQSCKFNHCSASFSVAVPSRNQSAQGVFVPATERPGARP